MAIQGISTPMPLPMPTVTEIRRVNFNAKPQEKFEEERNPHNAGNAPMSMPNRIYNYPPTSIYSPRKAKLEVNVNAPTNHYYYMPMNFAASGVKPFNTVWESKPSKIKNEEKNPETKEVAAKSDEGAAKPSNPIAEVKPVEKTPEAQPVVKKNEEVEKKAEPEIIKPETTVNTFVSDKVAILREGKTHEKTAVMNGIISLIKNNPKAAEQFYTQEVIDGLVTIINSDVSKEPGPSEDVLKLRAELDAGKEMSETKRQKAQMLSPKESAVRNKQEALIATALISKGIYDKLKANHHDKIVDFGSIPGTGILKMKATDKTEIPEVREYAIRSLALLNAPEFNKNLDEIFAETAKDPAEAVKVATAEVTGRQAA